MALSFAGAAKAEICKSSPQKHCCALAQAFGVLLFCNSFSGENIRIITESREFAQILPRLFHKAFGVAFDVYPSIEAPGKLSFQITEQDKICRIMNAFGFDPLDTVSLHVNYAAVEDDCCRSAFLKGAFLAGGSVTDPGKDYHLEFATTHSSVAREIFTLFQEVVGFPPKSAARGGTHILYLKQSEQVSDLLTFLGAPVAAMGIMEARLEKELSNKVNRRCNCDEANTSKVVEASQEHLNAIRILRERGKLEHLPQKLQQAAVAREENPEASLTELAAMMEPPITKPAMNHRLKKLILASKED